MGNLSYLVKILIVAKGLNADPCIDYLDTNDTTILTTYEPTDVADISCHSFTPFKWYRHTGTDDGLLTHVCPEGLQCGSHSQIWINDSFPTVDEGERPTQICIHTETSCCSSKNIIRTKNCSDFMVYFFIPTPPCVNYCFYSPRDVDQVKGGDSGGGITKTKTKWILPVAVGISCGLVLIVVITIIVCIVKHNNSITPERNRETVQNTRFTR